MAAIQGLVARADSDEDAADAAAVARLGRLGQGDLDALAELYDRYSPTIFSLSLRILRDRQAAEDVVQECFWRVWRGADAFDGRRGGVGAWICRIGRNAALDALRRARVRPSAPDEGPIEDWIALQADPAMEPAIEMARTLEHEQVRAAVGALDGEQRKVIELAYFEGLTRKEIAERTGVPLGTVHTRARLALGKLRLALGGGAALGDPAAGPA